MIIHHSANMAWQYSYRLKRGVDSCMARNVRKLWSNPEDRVIAHHPPPIQGKEAQPCGLTRSHTSDARQRAGEDGRSGTCNKFPN